VADTPFLVAGHFIDLTVSIGVATSHGTPTRDLLARADQAMYRAKTRGKSVHVPANHQPADSEERRRRRRGNPNFGIRTEIQEGTSPVPTDLYFDLSSSLRLAEHAVAAPRHAQPCSEHHDGLTCPGALVWVADEGTYLMSNGYPALLSDPDDLTSNIVVYAHTFGPDSDRDLLGATDVGFDDFAEYLHLTDGDPPLIDLLRDAAHDGYRWLVLRVDGATVTTRMHRSGPSDPVA